MPAISPKVIARYEDALRPIRGAALDAGPWTPICVISKEWTSYLNLCDPCVAARIAKKWGVKEIGERPGSLAPQRCSDCLAREQAAGG